MTLAVSGPASDDGAPGNGKHELARLVSTTRFPVGIARVLSVNFVRTENRESLKFTSSGSIGI